MEGPKSIGNLPKEVSVTGMMFPWFEEAPSLLSMPGSPHLYLPMFRSADELRAVMTRADAPFDKIKVVEVGQTFVDSLPRKSGDKEIRLIINPYFLPNGRVRYTEILRD